MKPILHGEPPRASGAARRGRAQPGVAVANFPFQPLSTLPMKMLTRLLKAPVKGALEFTASVRRSEDRDALFWSVYYPTNFGDWLGPYLYSTLVGSSAYFRVPDSVSAGSVYMAAGSIVQLAAKNAVVWGSGIISRTVKFERPWRTTAVRGPFTRERFLELGYPCPAVYGDPGILVPFVTERTEVPKRFALGIIPHYVDYEQVMAWYGGDPQINVIDVRLPVEYVIAELRACDCTVSSSLHGLILSHAYEIPSAWLEFSNRLAGDGVKFLDYFASGGVFDITPQRVSEGVASERLLEFARTAPTPKLAPLLQPLLDACPFPIPASVREAVSGRIAAREQPEES